VSSFEPPWLTESPTVTLLPDGRLQARLTTVRPNAPRAVEAIDDALLADGWTRDAPATFHRTVAGVEVVAVVEASPSPADPGALVIDRTFTTASAV
jgi:hypothetical protein